MAAKYVHKVELQSVKTASSGATTEPEQFDVSDVSDNDDPESSCGRPQLRWVNLAMGAVGFAFALSIAIAIGVKYATAGVTTKLLTDPNPAHINPFVALLYTSYVNTGTTASTYNAALAFVAVATVMYAAQAVSAAFNGIWSTVEKGMRDEGVNGLSMVIDVLSDVTSYIALLTFIYVQDGNVFGLMMLARVLISCVHYGVQSENNNFLKAKLADGGVAAPSFYILLIVACLGTAGLWLAIFPFAVDAFWFAVNNPLPLRLGLTITLFCLMAIRDIGVCVIETVRYWRGNTSWFTKDCPYFTTVEILRNLGLLFAIVTVTVAVWSTVVF
jgi:hypothetical protein